MFPLPLHRDEMLPDLPWREGDSDVATRKFLQEALLNAARWRLDVRFEGPEIALGQVAGQLQLRVGSHRDLVSLLPLPGDLASEWAPGNVLVRELGGDLVLAWRGGKVAHIDRSVLVVQAVDLRFAGTLERRIYDNVSSNF